MSYQPVYPNIESDFNIPVFADRNEPQQSDGNGISTSTLLIIPSAPTTDEWKYDFLKTPFNAECDFFDDWFNDGDDNINKNMNIYSYIDSCLRGVSQVIFVNNPITGLFFLTALGINNPMLCLSGLIGLMTSTSFSRCVLINKKPIRSGLYGYNGFLVGLAYTIFNINLINPEWIDVNDVIWKSTVDILSVVILSLFATLLNIFTNKYITSFTFPYHAIVWMAMIASFHSHEITPTTAIMPSTMPSYGIENGTMGSEMININIHYISNITNVMNISIWESALNGVSQIIFLDDMTSAILILLGIMISSRIMAISAFVGSLISTVVVYYLNIYNSDGNGNGKLSEGLWGYNSAIIAVCVAGMFIKLSFKSVAMALAFIIFGIIFQMAFVNIMSESLLPTLTFTSSVMASIAVSLADQLTGLEKPQIIVTPEINLVR